MAGPRGLAQFYKPAQNVYRISHECQRGNRTRDCGQTTEHQHPVLDLSLNPMQHPGSAKAISTVSWFIYVHECVCRDCRECRGSEGEKERKKDAKRGEKIEEGEREKERERQKDRGRNEEEE